MLSLWFVATERPQKPLNPLVNRALNILRPYSAFTLDVERWTLHTLNKSHIGDVAEMA